MNRLFSTFAVFAIFVSTAHADDWGHVSGKILWKGEIPEPVLIHKKGAAVKDAKDCSAKDLFQENLVVDKDTRGIVNVCIFMKKKPKKIHPDLEKFEPSIVFDQKNCQFVPHVLMVRAGQNVEVLNSDSVSHNTNMIPIRGQGQNQAIPGNTTAGNGTMYPVKQPQPLPITVKCDFHAWMKARWMVLDHPYGAITGTDGTFTIENVPAGKHTFRVWQEAKGWLERDLTVEIKAGETTELKPLEYNFDPKDL